MISLIATTSQVALRSMRRHYLILLAIFTTVGSLRAQESQRPLLIAAAADLKFALDEVLVEFRKAHPEHDTKTSYGSSGNLYAQIDNGAPFDIFFSADVKFPGQLIERGRGEKDSLFLYAVGRIVVWVPKDSKLDVERLGIQALLDPAVRKIAIANPKHAPYGAAAVAAMKKLGVHDQVSGKFVLGENVAQTAQFVQSGAADIGVIALSLAIAPRMKAEGRYWEVPLTDYPRMEQAGVIRTGAANAEGARQLRALLIAEKGRAVLQRYGFIVPESAP
jgi:molybdate transport system substrate-binding protein